MTLVKYFSEEPAAFEVPDEAELGRRGPIYKY